MSVVTAVHAFIVRVGLHGASALVWFVSKQCQLLSNVSQILKAMSPPNAAHFCNVRDMQHFSGWCYIS